MGLLSLGTPLSWTETKKYAEHVRTHGITQFLHTWNRVKDRHGDELLWGDEVEYMVVAFDAVEKNAKLSLRQSEILAKLSSICNDLSEEAGEKFSIPTFHPEYGRYMLESTPGSPYTGSLSDLISVESNMRYRRSLARKHLKAHEIPITFTSFPRLGAPGVFTEPYFDPADAVSSHSLFLPQEITNPHARFPTLTANIRSRRGSKVAINLPLFFDSKTPKPFIDPTVPWDRSIYAEDAEAKNGAALPDHIYMDAMGFGMGCCCLQLTFQACNVPEARKLYDAFVPLGPIMLALTAASPLYRGYIADVDCRWNVIAGSVDDRTEEERGLKPLKENKYVIPKSRYDSVDLYISQDPLNRPEYNDSSVPFDAVIYERLKASGVDDSLSRHVAHLYIRDPLVLFSELIDQDDMTSMDHFENIQSTNWQTVRFKPPPPNSSIGWRVEFRSMEVQLTDFENAAFAIFMVLLSRAILCFDLNLYMPITKVDENMQIAQKRDAARKEKFYFRRNVFSSHSPSATSSSSSVDENGNPKPKEKRLRNCFDTPPRAADLIDVPLEDQYELMTLEEIMLGKGLEYPGLLGLVRAYLDTLEVDGETNKKLKSYLNLIERRANGTLLTTACWIRNFVRSHPAYKFDSVINQEINFDLMTAVDQIERGTRKEPSLLPEGYRGGFSDEGCVAGQSGALSEKDPRGTSSVFSRVWTYLFSLLGCIFWK
ncbi:GSH1 [Sanghuangporus sanghuang]